MVSASILLKRGGPEQQPCADDNCSEVSLERLTGRTERSSLSLQPGRTRDVELAKQRGHKSDDIEEMRRSISSSNGEGVAGGAAAHERLSNNLSFDCRKTFRSEASSIVLLMEERQLEPPGLPSTSGRPSRFATPRSFFNVAKAPAPDAHSEGPSLDEPRLSLKSSERLSFNSGETKTNGAVFGSFDRQSWKQSPFAMDSVERPSEERSSAGRSGSGFLGFRERPSLHSETSVSGMLAREKFSVDPKKSTPGREQDDLRFNPVGLGSQKVYNMRMRQVFEKGLRQVERATSACLLDVTLPRVTPAGNRVVAPIPPITSPQQFRRKRAAASSYDFVGAEDDINAF
jgi:hypothetical protein